MLGWLKKYKEIADGWYYDAFPTEEIVKLADGRAKECATCPLNRDNTCDISLQGAAVKDLEYDGEKRYKGLPYNGCGCPLSKKTKSPTSKCPLGKW